MRNYKAMQLIENNFISMNRSIVATAKFHPTFGTNGTKIHEIPKDPAR